MNLILKAENIHKTYKHPDNLHILKGIDLELKKNQSIAIMGSSGVGKTTLLHILGTLEAFDKGNLCILNNSRLTDNIRNKHIGFIFQTYNLLEDLTLLDNILMPARIARQNIKKGSAPYKRALLLLKEVRLEERSCYLTRTLSGGEKQRAAIARAFCNNPDIILADEPSGNLDHENSKIIHSMLLNSVKKFNKSLIVATHDKELACLCDQIYLMEEGKLKKK